MTGDQPVSGDWAVPGDRPVRGDRRGHGGHFEHGDYRMNGDRGAGSVFVLAVGLVLVAGGVAGAAVGAARVGRHEARTAADLGALAGAMRAIEGPGSACARANELVSANGGRMVSCRLEGLEVVVEVTTQVTPLPVLTVYAGATARAGPLSG